MYFSFVLYTFVMALVLVKGQEFPHAEPEGPHKYIDVGHCRNARKEFELNRMNAALKPRERHVVLKPEQGWEFSPRTVNVKRCVGHCPDRYSPMPMDDVPKSFIVQRHRKGEKMSMKCVAVTVMEHTNCKCLCMRDKTYCNEQEDWDEAICGCRCKGRAMLKPECEAVTGMLWNDDNCSCQCRNKITECPNKMQWNDEYCKCM